MAEQKTQSITALQEQVRQFCEARGWNQFHSLKNLTIGAVTEAAELVEPFRFRSDEESTAFFNTTQGREAVEDELADVFFFLLRISQKYDVDLGAAMQRKLVKNAVKYPAPSND